MALSSDCPSLIREQFLRLIVILYSRSRCLYYHSLYLWAWGSRISNSGKGNSMLFEFCSAIASVIPKHCMSASNWLWGVLWAIFEESIEVYTTIRNKDSLAACSTSLFTWVVNVVICPCRVEIISIIAETCLNIGESCSCKKYLIWLLFFWLHMAPFFRCLCCTDHLRLIRMCRLLAGYLYLSPKQVLCKPSKTFSIHKICPGPMTYKEVTSLFTLILQFLLSTWVLTDNFLFASCRNWNCFLTLPVYY